MAARAAKGTGRTGTRARPVVATATKVTRPARAAKGIRRTKAPAKAIKATSRTKTDRAINRTRTDTETRAKVSNHTSREAAKDMPKAIHSTKVIPDTKARRSIRAGTPRPRTGGHRRGTATRGTPRGVKAIRSKIRINIKMGK